MYSLQPFVCEKNMQAVVDEIASEIGHKHNHNMAGFVYCDLCFPKYFCFYTSELCMPNLSTNDSIFIDYLCKTVLIVVELLT